MPMYRLTVREVLEHTIMVEADSEEAARDIDPDTLADLCSDEQSVTVMERDITDAAEWQAAV